MSSIGIFGILREKEKKARYHDFCYMLITD